MKNVKLFAASLLVLAGAPALAFAGDCASTPSCDMTAPVIVNGQMQFGDAIATLNVEAASSTGAALGGTAAGNAFSVRSQETGIDVVSHQDLGANVAASNNVNIGAAYGATVSSAVAQGNAGQIEACCSNVNAATWQTNVAGKTISAVSNVKVGSSDVIVSNAQTAGNNWAIASKNSYLNSHAGQYSGATITSVSNVEACCNNGSITSAALAAANTNSIVGSNATIYSTTEQKNYGNVGAYSSIKNNSATNNLGSASAVANNATLTNEWGYASLTGYQENSGAVHAQSIVLNNDFAGSAVSSASAMGNSALVSNIGADAFLGMAQNNYGSAPVTAYASFTGATSQGGVGMATSFAAGNTMTGFACAACAGGPVKMEGYANQYNYANVNATTNINMGQAGMIVGSATAIGNNATFIAQRGGN